MEDQSFDTLARRAAGACDRRSALTMLAGAALGSTPALAAVGKGGNNKKDNREKRQKKQVSRCRKQSSACAGVAADYCYTLYGSTTVVNVSAIAENTNADPFLLAACDEKAGDSCFSTVATVYQA